MVGSGIVGLIPQKAGVSTPSHMAALHTCARMHIHLVGLSFIKMFEAGII